VVEWPSHPKKYSGVVQPPPQTSKGGSATPSFFLVRYFIIFELG
jgi:hypothetical protein